MVSMFVSSLSMIVILNKLFDKALLFYFYLIYQEYLYLSSSILPFLTCKIPTSPLLPPSPPPPLFSINDVNLLWNNTVCKLLFRTCWVASLIFHSFFIFSVKRKKKYMFNLDLSHNWVGLNARGWNTPFNLCHAKFIDSFYLFDCIFIEEKAK